MHILSELDVTRIFHSLTKEQCEAFIYRLSDALASVSVESKPTIPESERLIHQPLRTVFTTNDHNTHMFMPVSNTVNTGIKIVSIGSSGIHGVVNIFSPDGRLSGLLAAEELTAFRTALTTMALFVRCITLRKENILVFGSGRQAEWHVRQAVLLYPGLVRRVTVVNRGRKRLDEMDCNVLAGLRTQYPSISFITLAAEGVADYHERLCAELAACDVIFSCTPSSVPNFQFSALQSAPKQRFISLIGSYKPHMHEIDSDTLLSGGGRIYVDSKKACLEESGELITAHITEGQLTELGDILADQGLSNEIDVPNGCNIIYKCVGMGLMDLVVGNQVLELGKEQGLGVYVSGI
jgi:ornithine cyclodeaminase